MRVKRTGNKYAASSEYLATLDDGTTETIWSPPWHELTEKKEDRRAIVCAYTLWERKQGNLAREETLRKACRVFLR